MEVGKRSVIAAKGPSHILGIGRAEPLSADESAKEQVHAERYLVFVNPMLAEPGLTRGADAKL